MSRQLALVQDAHLPPPFCAPINKYPGAKNWLVPLLVPGLHNFLTSAGPDSTFHEPFAGSLTMGLSLGWPHSVYADASPDLVCLHRTVRDDVVALHAVASRLAGTDPVTEESFYSIREDQRRNAIARHLSDPEWAARVLFLIGRGFNGLWRTNRKGQNNVPVGRDAKGNLFKFNPPSLDHLQRASAALAGSMIECGDFAFVLDRALKGDPTKAAIYLDSPYGAKLKNVSKRGAKDRGKPGKDAGVFTGYAGSFTWDDQIRLADWAKALAVRGALVVASNSWTDEVCDLYRNGFALFQVGVQHSVGATGARRGKRAELLAISEAHAGVFNPGALPVRRMK